MEKFIFSRISKLRASFTQRYRGNYSLIKHDMKRHYNKDNVDEDGNNALHIAARDGKSCKVSFFLPNVSDIHIQNNDGNDALMLAAENGHEKVVKKLLAAGANVFAKNKRGETASELAKINDRWEVAKIITLYIGNLRFGNDSINRSIRHRETQHDVYRILTSDVAGKKIVNLHGNPNAILHDESAIINASSLTADAIHQQECLSMQDEASSSEVIDTRVFTNIIPSRNDIDKKQVHAEHLRVTVKSQDSHTLTSLDTLWVIKSTRPNDTEEPYFIDDFIPVLDTEPSSQIQDTIPVSTPSSQIQDTIPVSTPSSQIQDTVPVSAQSSPIQDRILISASSPNIDDTTKISLFDDSIHPSHLDPITQSPETLHRDTESHFRTVVDSPEMFKPAQDLTTVKTVMLNACQCCQAASLKVHRQENQTDPTILDILQAQEYSKSNETTQKQKHQPESEVLNYAKPVSKCLKRSVSQKSLITVQISIDQNEPSTNSTVGTTHQQVKIKSCPDLRVYYSNNSKHYNIKGNNVVFDGSTLNHNVRQETDTASEDKSLQHINDQSY